MAKIMIVDDNRTMVDMMTTVVGLFGHVAVPALGGEQALNLIADGSPDVVIMDLSMPGMDGFETLRRLRAMPQGAGVPVIVVTAAAEADLEERIALAGGTACLQKPVGMNDLAQAISRHASRAA